MNAMKQEPLLEWISARAGCSYLSDLRFLSEEQRGRLARELEALSPSAQDLWSWNDALKYLADAPPEQTAQAAKEQLIRHLSSPRPE